MFVRLIKLPHSIRGLTVVDEEGNHNVYINRNIGYQMQLLTYQHEAEHVANGDLHSLESVIVLEARAKK